MRGRWSLLDAETTTVLTSLPERMASRTGFRP
jgi:hypothetical protein